LPSHDLPMAADDETVLVIVKREAFGDALDRRPEEPLAAPSPFFGFLQRADVVDPAQALAAGEADMAALVRSLDVGDDLRPG
jgi:hypothetical protein